MNIQTIYEGNIGVNKNNPQYPLDISGSVKFTTIRDTNNNIGSSGQVLSSTGNGLSWTDVSGGGGSGSTSIVVSNDTTDTTNFLTFVNNPPNGTSQSLKGNSNLIYDAFNNRVGIGTATPSTTLDVSGTANITGNLSVDTNTLFVDASNNRVGIGTTSPISSLQVEVSGGDSQVRIRGSRGQLILSETGVKSWVLETGGGNIPTGAFGLIESGIGARLTCISGGNIGIGTTTPSSTLDVSGTGRISGNLSVDTNTLFVDAANNNLGIGTTTPETKLDVVGNSIQCSNQGRFKGWYSGGQGSGLATEIGTLSGEGYINTYDRTAGTYGNLNLIAGSTANIRLQTNGNVGIGTSTPSATLDVSGTGRISGNLSVDTNTLFVDASNNRVGVGTTTPSTLLDCYGEGSFGFQDFRTQATQRVLSLRAEPVSGQYSQSRYNFYTKPGTTVNGVSNLSIRSQYAFDAESGDLFTLAGNGNVGIGTTTPATRLVIGDSVLNPDQTQNNNSLIIKSQSDTVNSRKGGINLISTNGYTSADIGVPIQWLSDINGTIAYSTASITGRRGFTGLNNGGGYLQFATSTIPGSLEERMRIDHSGNVGIGTSAPSEKLNINGGNLLMNGTFDGVLMNPGSGAGSLAITRGGTFTNNVQQINAPYTDNIGGSSGGGAQISLLKDEMTFSTYPNTGTLGNPITLTERMRIKSTGVGINTTNPVYKLQVEGSGTANEVVAWFNNQGAFSSSIAVRQAAKTAYITNHSGSGTPNYDGQLSNAISFGVSSGASPIQFWNGNTGVGSRGTAKMTILENGNTGIGTSAPTFQLQLSTDSAAKPTSNTWTISSDQRVKTNIENADLDRCNEIVENLSLKRFQWSEKYFPNVSDRNSIGFIAQEVEQYFPNAVKTHKNKFLLQKGETEEENIYEEIEDFKSLDIDQLIKCLFGSVKYLQNKVKTLEERIAKLE